MVCYEVRWRGAGERGAIISCFQRAWSWRPGEANEAYLCDLEISKFANFSHYEINIRSEIFYIKSNARISVIESTIERPPDRDWIQESSNDYCR